MDFSSKLIHWYQKNKRDLPWRKTKDPYKIWISEVILQQTRVNQGLPYYIKFLDRYPSLYDLSLANEKEVLLLWQGLGYYKRAINLLESAKTIVKKNNGNFPSNFDDINFERMVKECGFKIINKKTITPNIWTVMQIRALFKSEKIGEKSKLWNKSYLNKKGGKEKIKILKYFKNILKLILHFLITFINRTIDILGKGDSLIFFLILEKK